MADIGCNMSFALKNTLAVFWTQYMGLELWYSLLLVIVNIWDAINDPLIGTVIDSDRHKYKRNKFLAYIRFGSIGLIFSGAVCFIPVPNAPIWVKILIFVSGYIIWDAFYTITNVPYGALLSLISKKSEDRASLSAWRSVGSTKRLDRRKSFLGGSDNGDSRISRFQLHDKKHSNKKRFKIR